MAGEPTERQNVQLTDLEAALPRYLRRDWRRPNLDEGLDISVDRSYGAFLIRNLQETAIRWVEDPSGTARSFNRKKFRASPRVFLFAGTMMKDRRFMFPLSELPGANDLPDYAFEDQLAVAPNTEEVRVWEEMFRKYQMQAILFGPSQLEDRLREHEIVFNPLASDPADLVPVDSSGKHVAFTISNHPNWILPTAMAVYNTSRFKRNCYEFARGLAFKIDNGQAARVVGYTPPEDWGVGVERGDGSTVTRQYWYENFERHGKTDHIPFLPGRQFRT